MRAISHRFFVLLLVAILAVGSSIRLVLLAQGVPTLDSDESVIGLMALHVFKGEVAVFFWGQHYMGSLEAIVTAPIFALFGASPVTLRIAPLLIGVVAIGVIALLARTLAGTGVALVTAMILACGPPFFIIVGMRAFGGYVETLLFGPLLVILTRRGVPTCRDALLAGGLLGIAVWTNVLIIPFIIACIGIVWCQGTYWQWRSQLAALVVGGGGGLAPAIVYNIVHPLATINTLLGLTIVSGNAHDPTGTVSLVQQMVNVVTVALPIIVGGPGGLHSAGMTLPEHNTVTNAALGQVLIASSIALSLLLLLISSGMRVWHNRHQLIVTPGVTPTAHQCREQLRASLLFICICYLLAFCLSKQANIATMPRYLFPLYATTPLFIDEAYLRLRQFTPSRWRGIWVRWSIIISVLCAIIGYNLANSVNITPIHTAARDHSQWIATDDTNVVAFLQAHHLRTVISNDYWVGMRLTFLARESAIIIMVTPEDHVGYNHYLPYVQAGLSDQSPAYLELTGTPEVAIRMQKVASTYTYTEIGPYTIFYPSPLHPQV